jgi:hypothetical protein
MREQLTSDIRNSELMGDNIIGIYLSEEPLCESNQPEEDDEPKLRRFVYSQENIEQPHLIDIGEHGAVIWAVIKETKYALKVVSTITLDCYIYLIPSLVQRLEATRPCRFPLQPCHIHFTACV